MPAAAHAKPLSPTLQAVWQETNGWANTLIMMMIIP